jgi:ribosome biogenesis GTPase A
MELARMPRIRLMAPTHREHAEVDGHMASELDGLLRQAQQLTEQADGRPEAASARRLADRFATGRFLIAVVGEFKRGKSTLVNALLGEAVVPTGVLPLTSVATELAYGDPGAVVEFLDGRRVTVPTERFGEYATEAGNPGNHKGVARVEVRGQWPLLDAGVVLVDTPGVGSVHEHNTEAGQAALLDADGAIVVLSADAPLSEHERDLLEMLVGRRSPTFFVLNKADHLEPSELAQVQRFVTRTITEILGTEVELFAIDARTAMTRAECVGVGVGVGTEHRPFDADFERFTTELTRFISQDLVTTRLVVARRELARLGTSLSDAVTLEQVARNLTAERLDQLVDRFRDEANRQRRGFEDDRTLLGRDLAQLVGDIGRRLDEFASTKSRELATSLAPIASSSRRRTLGEDLRRSVQSAVEGAFDELRKQELRDVEERWAHIADAFRLRSQERVDTARRAASELFEVPLPRLEIPRLDHQADRFSFLFLHVGSVTEPFGRIATRLVPARWARPAALERANKELADELDKHAGRARWDMAQRLESARRDLEREMRVELDNSIDAILQAADRAHQWQKKAREDRERERLASRHLEQLARELAALGEELT